jgi:hypothetical protein
MIQNFEDQLVLPNQGYRRGTSDKTQIKSKMSTLVFHLLFNHSKTSAKKMDSNVLCWDVQFVSKFGYIILLEIPKETTNDWVNILGIERV